MTGLTQREYLRKIAPDFSVLEMLEQAYYQGKLKDRTDIAKDIFYYPDTNPVLYRAMFLFDAPEADDMKYFTNEDNFIYEVYNYGERYVAIAVLIDRFLTANGTNSSNLPSYGITVNPDIDTKVFGVGF